MTPISLQQRRRHTGKLGKTFRGNRGFLLIARSPCGGQESKLHREEKHSWRFNLAVKYHLNRNWLPRESQVSIELPVKIKMAHYSIGLYLSAISVFFLSIARCVVGFWRQTSWNFPSIKPNRTRSTYPVLCSCHVSDSSRIVSFEIYFCPSISMTFQLIILSHDSSLPIAL